MIFDVYPKYKNKPIITTKRASEELMECSLSIESVVKILEDGFDCAAGKRKENILERGLQKGAILFKVVIVEKEDKFILIHAGKLSFLKSMKKKFRRKNDK